MFKRLMKYLARLRNSLVAGTVAQLSAIAVATLVFVVLAKMGVLSHAPVRGVPIDYTALKPLESVDLEQKLKAKSPEVIGLITFEGVRHIVVLSPGFENDRIVVDAEVDEMVAQAKAAKIPISTLPSVQYDTGHNLWFWVGLVALIAWFLFFLFRKRDQYIPSRFVALWESVSAVANGYIQRNNYPRFQFYLTAWIVAFGCLFLLSASRLFHDQPKRVLPREYAVQKQTPSWQLERVLQAHPEVFQRAVVVEGTNAIAVVLHFEGKAAADFPAMKNKDGTETKPATVTVARVVQFANTDEGRVARDNLVEALKARNVAVKTVPSQVLDGWGETMSPVLLWIHILLGIALVGTLITIGVHWEQWSQEEAPKVKRNGAAAGGGVSTSTGQRAELKDKTKKTLDDVAGCDEAVAKFRMVVEWMKDAKAYEHYGAKLPNGVLLYGPPGTGKTLLARAVAGEIDGNFFHASASEFIEMYVGVGAKRVRDFFAQGRNAHRRTGKISVLFLDEIDAVGKRRSDHGTSGDGERDQTVNQLLTCIQGFDANSGCLLIAATNRPETLDEGLKRSGRFDIKIEIAKPDRKGRRDIFRVHGRKADLEPGVDRDELYMELARRAHDFTGADIELAVNEALTRAAKRNAHLFAGKSDDEIAAMPRTVSRQEFHEGIDFVLYGEMIKSRVRSDKERWATSVHEIGHAAVPTVLKGDPVSRITIVMTTKSLGLMESQTEEDRYGWSKDQFMMRIKTMLAGRAAEELIAGEVSTGASNDFERASQLARYMVGVYGMSDLGPISIPLDEFGFPRAHIGTRLEAQFDEAWRKIISDCDSATRELILAHREQILSASRVLLDEETLTGDRFREVWAGSVPVLAVAEQTTAIEPDQSAKA
jgi:cell division protease FtsH